MDHITRLILGFCPECGRKVWFWQKKAKVGDFGLLVKCHVQCYEEIKKRAKEYGDLANKMRQYREVIKNE